MLCNCINSTKNKHSLECKSKSIGTYVFSKELSKIDMSKDSNLLIDLRLILREDESFMLSKKIPHLDDSTGMWTVINDKRIEGQYPYIELNFNNGIIKQTSCCCGDNNRIAINCPYQLSENLPENMAFCHL